jgi:hypothetical protein
MEANLVLKEDDGVVVADSGLEQAAVVGGGVGAHYFEAGAVSVPEEDGWLRGELEGEWEGGGGGKGGGGGRGKEVTMTQSTGCAGRRRRQQGRSARGRQ